MIKGGPLVSIVIATYNGARFLREQLESVLAQTHKNLDVILSDDGSEDGTFRIAGEFSEADERLRIFSNKQRLGVTANFLTALKHCRGDLVCFCDQDDCWRLDKVECLLRLISSNERTVLAYSDLEVCDESLNLIHPSFWRMSVIRPIQGIVDERSLFRNITPGCSMMFRRVVREKMLGCHNEAPFLHDHFAFVTSCGTGEILFTKEKLLKYRQHERNVIGADRESFFDPSLFLIEIRKRIDFFEKYPSLQGGFNLKKLGLFCDAYEQKKFWQWNYLGYYLFFHSGGWKGRSRAICETLLPRLYRAIKTSLGT